MTTSRIKGRSLGRGAEHLVAYHLEKAGWETAALPRNFRGRDLFAARGADQVSIQVKARVITTDYVTYNDADHFDWLAIVVVDLDGKERFFLMPRAVADAAAKQWGTAASMTGKNHIMTRKVAALFAAYEDNFGLQQQAKLTEAAA